MIVCYQNNIEKKVGHTALAAPFVRLLGVDRAYTKCMHWIGFVIGNMAERDLVCNRKRKV